MSTIETVNEPIWRPPDLNQDLAAIQKYKYYKYNNISQYDKYFKKYTEKYFNKDFDFLYLKSQSIAESNLNPNAISPVGAIGLMQIMPKTYTYIITKNPELKGSINDIETNIASGIYYMSLLWNRWKQKQTWIDHWDFCTSSYNAGMGNIIKAQKISIKLNLNPNIWTSIQRTLPQVTGKHSTETINYVSRIKEIRYCLINL